MTMHKKAKDEKVTKQDPWTKVDESSWESFPASDPPGWIEEQSGAPDNEAKEEMASADSDTKVVLDINPEIVCQIVNKAREFHAQEGVVIPDEGDSSFSIEDPQQILASHEDDLSYQEVKTAIGDLEPDQQITLVALMWLGRGDYEVKEWQICLDEARSRYTNHTAEYLLATPLVADYLLEGLSLLGHSCEGNE